MEKVTRLFIKHRRSILVSLVVFIAFGFSIYSSYIVQTLGCGYMSYLDLIDCGFYAGFPVPYTKYNSENIRKLRSKNLLNPTTYYKYRYSPFYENRVFAEKFLSQGNIFPFYLQKPEQYQFSTGMFLLNSILWIAPSFFLIYIFF